MPNIIKRAPWYLDERFVTPENVFRNRRQFLKQMGFTAAAAIAAPSLLAAEGAKKGYPYPRTPEFNPGWKLTDEKVAGSYNNFYEFSLQKDRVKNLTGKFVTSPWPIQISGLCEQPMTIDAAELVDTMPIEERVYRFRCVEAWTMIVPWTGFPLSKLIEKAKPKTEAKFIRFETANRPEQMPGISALPNYPWPYFEGLRMDEAMHPLTLIATGIYGKPMAKQHGAPLRIVVPWKYGYKSIKSVVKIEFIAKQPTTFWETLQANEYPFESNVNPAVPHPRWSQATERMIDTN
ncbi:MAG TPA: protein-methionine-sulfoxide reductase catalytic subunit MsrP, partial [Candidatus Acidoferrum sp.]|nr:protein-methionine-sulfoxide reductase catalytic subunit MsrP [Candidatus Acidoferrum sp.]